MKELMIFFCILNKFWEMVVIDLFIWDKFEYLIIVDYYFRYFEVVKLLDIKSIIVIIYIKFIFVRYGILFEVISDNGF